MSIHSMPRGPWDDPWGASCKSCNMPIFDDQPSEQIAFAQDNGHKLEELNGTYHVECARPILSAKRAFDMLSRWGI